jgi:hypothetical protein
LIEQNTEGVLFSQSLKMIKMPIDKPVADIVGTLKSRLFPAITLWNRLDGRPYTNNFDRALKAEVRDPLWMLCRQWQMGEFKGDDAASPVFAKVHIAKTELNKYQPDSHPVQVFERDVPLETKVEHRPIPFKRGGQVISLDIRLLMGRQWLKQLDKGGLGTHTDDFKKAFPIKVPIVDEKNDPEIRGHIEVWQQFSAVADRKMDGYALLEYLTLSATPQYNDLPNGVILSGLDPILITNINIQAEKFKKWYKKLFYQPEKEDENAWVSNALEYRFACSAPVGSTDEKVIEADEYYHGHLDWYNFDKSDKKTKLDIPLGRASTVDQKPITKSFIPAPLEFNGMPNTRWWAFEDKRTNFGDIKPDTTDIAKLLLIEFGLVYANDWFLIPVTIPMGSIAEVSGLTITNNFGERLWIDAASRDMGEGRQKNWNMFGVNVNNSKTDKNQKIDKSILMLPTVPKIQESKPIEEVMLIRDEMANMVWGIETIVPLAHGKGKSGSETATQTQQFYNKFIKPKTNPLIENDAKIRYEVMNSVPLNWIPFIPVHIKDDDRKRETQLQRASMPRIIEGEKIEDIKKVKPLTALLREGLEATLIQAYFIHEQEVPRAGIVVSQSFQRTRWVDGRVFTWLGVSKQTGRGEGESNLRFDSLVPIKPKETVNP